MKTKIIAVPIDLALIAGMYFGAFQGNQIAENLIVFACAVIGFFGLLFLIVALLGEAIAGPEKMAEIVKAEGPAWKTYDILSDLALVLMAAAAGWLFIAVCVSVGMFGKAIVRAAAKNAKDRITEATT